MNARIAGILVILMLTAGTVNIYAASQSGQSRPVELKADSIDYDSVKGIMTAKGGIRLTQDNMVITGHQAEYNTKTKEGLVQGDVKAVQADTMVTAAEVRSYDDNYLVATGNVFLTKGESILNGPQLEYFSDLKYALVTGGVRMETTDGIITADKMETYFDEERSIATGKVHIVSEKRNMTADSDYAVYYKGQDKQQSRIILTGNAKAIQDGNVIVGNTLTLYLDAQTVEAQDRTKLVIKPQPKAPGQAAKPLDKPKSMMQN